MDLSSDLPRDLERDVATQGASGRADEAESTGTTGKLTRRARVLKRIGVAGFLFFLVKGLLWLAVPAALLLKARWLPGS